MARLTLLPVVALVFLAGCLGLGSRAEHVWSVALEPLEEGAYTLEIPFLVAAGGEDRTLDALRQGVRVTAGDATITWAGEGSVLIVEANGAVALEARHQFRGDVGQREAFSSWTIPREDIRRADGGGPPVHVAWTVDFSGGEGHTCWAEAHLEAHVPSDGAASLTAQGTEPGPGSGTPWATECA